MSTLYQDLDLTNFPNEIDQRYIMEDPSTSDELLLINQFNNLIKENRLDEALEVVKNNPILEKMFFNAEKHNRHEDQIIAIQRFWKSNIHQYLVELVVNRGIYSSKIAYQKYNVVFYEKNKVMQAYMAVENNIPAGTLPTTGKFVPITLRGEKGETGTGLAWRGKYQPDIEYYFGDCVSFNGSLWVYVNETESYGKIPAHVGNGDTQYWDAAFSPETIIPAEFVQEDSVRRFLKIGQGKSNRVLIANTDGDAAASNLDVDNIWHKGNLSYGTSNPSGGSSGDIYFKIVG